MRSSPADRNEIKHQILEALEEKYLNVHMICEILKRDKTTIQKYMAQLSRARCVNRKRGQKGQYWYTFRTYTGHDDGEPLEEQPHDMPYSHELCLMMGYTNHRPKGGVKIPERMPTIDLKKNRVYVSGSSLSL